MELCGQAYLQDSYVCSKGRRQTKQHQVAMPDTSAVAKLDSDHIAIELGSSKVTFGTGTHQEATKAND